MATSRSLRKYGSPTLTPSPLRRKSFVPPDSDLDADSDLDTQPIVADDIFGRSSAFSAKTLRKHYPPDSQISKSSSIKGKSTTPIPIEDAEGVFLSNASTSSRSHSKVTPRVSNPRAKRSIMPPPIAFPTQSSSSLPHTAIQTPVKSQPATGSSASRKLPATSGTVGVKRKPTPLPVTAPYPKRGMTPLGVTKAEGEGSFGRLAPLPAPKFRNGRSSGETEGLLRTESATLARLRIDKGEGDVVLGEEEEAVDVSPGGHITKRLARSRPVSQELMDSANAASQSLLQTLAAAKPKHKSNTSSVTFPTTRSRTSSTTSSPLTSPKPRQRTMHASNVSTSSSHSKREEASYLVRTRKPSTSQLRHPTKRIESSGSATLFFSPAVPRSPEASTPARSRPATMFALDSPAGASSTPTYLRPRPAFGPLASTSRHSYAGLDSSLFGKARGLTQPTTPSSPTSEFLPLRGAEMGDISDEDGSDFAPVEVDIRALDDEGGAEDLFFSSSSFINSRDIGPDTSFGWDSTPTIVPSSLTVNVTQSTPSPRSKSAPFACKLEKKYRPRDSGVELSEDESNNSGSHAVTDFLPPAPRQRYTLGRSESVNLTVPRASTSVSTLGSGSSDQELVTPIFGPSTSSGWPFLTSSSSAASSLSTPDVTSADAFIMRILMQAARRDEHAPLGGSDVGGSIRPPGTPQKRVKTAMAFSGARPWQSAVASKIGFDFGNNEEEEEEDRGVKGLQGGGVKAAKRSKKAPRKSLPAAFPLLAKASRGRGRAAGAEDSEEETGDGSPSERRAAYDGLGLGRPSVTKAAGASWLLRRSSSGAISSATSGSGSMSGDGSPTGTGAIHGWQLPPPRIPPRMSPLKSSIPSHLASNRTASSSSEASSTVTATMLASPTTRRLQTLPQSARGPGQHRRGNSEHDMRVSLGGVGLGTYAQPGRFEREFVEIGEVGSGEFGKVMKVRRHISISGTGTGAGLSGDISAVKKSKRFEGVRHRLRLREEVEILQHLSNTYAAVNGPGTRHPNVLAYIDSWEQDDALYIQTELCEFGNFAHFLWEYGRAFPQLDEARVWKIIADLSNGLHFIHESGVIHLDLKPANIFITHEGRFKIGDFGMASLWPRPVLTSPSAGSQEASLRAARTAFEREGDKLYLAPEVLQGKYGKAADMFSFGITVLETASNIVVPGEGEPWHRLRHGDLSPADLPTDTSPELRALISALLCASPEARIDSAAVCAHPVVVRTRAAMERLLEEALRAGERPFAASPLAGVPASFLMEVLSHSREPTAVAINADGGDAMDVGA